MCNLMGFVNMVSLFFRFFFFFIYLVISFTSCLVGFESSLLVPHVVHGTYLEIQGLGDFPPLWDS